VIFLVLIAIILVSALQRLILYIDAFGLTIDRLTALAVMAGLACGIGLLALTILRGQRQFFAGGLAAAGIVIVFGFALANPAAIVARVNIDRAIDNGQQVDIGYLLNLGSDAVPALVENLDRIAGPGQCETISVIAANWYSLPHMGRYEVDDWRAFNFSMRRAERLIDERQAGLTARLRECLR